MLPSLLLSALLSSPFPQALQREASQLPVDPTLFRTIEKRVDHAQSRLAREHRRDEKALDGRGDGGNAEDEAGGGKVGGGAKEGSGVVKKEGGGGKEKPLSRRQVERAARKALTGFDPLDVLKGVSVGGRGGGGVMLLLFYCRWKGESVDWERKIIFYDGVCRLKGFRCSLAWEVCVFVCLLLEWCKGCKGWCVVPCRVVDLLFLFVFSVWEEIYLWGTKRRMAVISIVGMIVGICGKRAEKVFLKR